MEEKKERVEAFVLNTGTIASTLRLLVEGAITLYDDEASTLFHLGLKHQKVKETHAFEAIGTGLFELRMHIMNLQELYEMEISGQRKALGIQDEE